MIMRCLFVDALETVDSDGDGVGMIIAMPFR